MKKTVSKFLMTALVAGMLVPLAAHAADDELQKKIDALAKEVADLKSSVKKVEDKSLGRWLTIGGDYRFRVDSLYGETKAYTSAPAFMGALMTNPATAGFFALPQTQSLLATTYYPAVAGLTPNAMMGNLVGYLMGTGLSQAQAMQTLQQIGASAFSGAYAPKNQTLYTNKFGLDLTVKATQDVTVHAKLDMYKTFGSQNDNAVTGSYFSDRVGVFDGTLGHIPSDGYLNVDQVYATWNNILDQPVWLSIGRRPSTNGTPSQLRLNNERPGNGGIPSILVDYAFDGMVLGYAPDIEALPGAYGKVCYGRGFDSGYKSGGNNQPTNGLNDTDMLGVSVVPYDTDPLRLWVQYNRGFNIFDFPVMNNTVFGNTAPTTNLGSIDWYGAGVLSTLKKVGPGNLNLFVDGAMSVTHPNDTVSAQAGFQGLMTGAFLAPENPTSRTGWAVYTGIRYDLPSKTKIGFEYNYGSKYWITFAPAADDMWTSKVGTRGSVFEPYIIQELDLKPISSYLSKAFFRLGYQYYDFEYTGSNNWVGKPQKISSIQADGLQMLTPVSKAHDVYATFEVHF
jgi:hypothetical protein